MIRNTIVIILLTYLFALNSFAEQALDIDLSAIAALEREQIIKELSFRLDTKQNCNATPSWDDAGSGADLDGFFFIPKVSSGEYIIGGHASQKRRSKHHCVLTVNEPSFAAPLPLSVQSRCQSFGATNNGGAPFGLLAGSLTVKTQ